MKNARATHFSDPGNFRKSQNWINGSRPTDAELVPPPVDKMHKALYDFEKFLYEEIKLKNGLYFFGRRH